MCGCSYKTRLYGGKLVRTFLTIYRIDMNVDEVKDRAGPREFSPKDDLPEEYRKAATRMLEFHANSEIMGAFLDGPSSKAPSIERKMAFRRRRSG